MNLENSLIVQKKLKQKDYIILYFFIYSFFGWLMETVYSLLVLGHFSKRGFLFSPICPIYGFGTIIMLIFISRYKKNSLKLFFASSIIFSIFEYMVGFALDAIFAAKWWDYTYDFFNLNGRISILYSIAWGFIGLIFINHIHPFVSKKVDMLLDYIPKKLIVSILYILLLLIATDFILSSLRYLGVF